MKKVFGITCLSLICLTSATLTFAEETAAKASKEQVYSKAKSKYKTLKITPQMEKAVIEHLQDIGALQTCYVQGSSACKGGCPSGQGCVETTTHNCVCSNK